MQETESRVALETVNQAITSLDKYILNHYGRPTRRTLRERQITVVEDLRDTLRGGQTEGYVTIPTGVGKTVLFTEVTEALNEQEILEAMIVVPTKILVDQTAERFRQFAPDLEVGKLYTFAHDITRPVTITTYASLVRHIEDGTLDPRLYKLLVLDEVHRSLSGKRSQAVAQFTNAIKLGFTATPMYSEDRNVANLLNTEIHKMTIREAVEENLLSPFSAIIAETEVDLTNISIKGNGDYDDRELEEAINIQSRNQAAVDLYQKLFPGRTAIAYCNSVKHAEDVAKLFLENGVVADFVSGYQDKKEQAETLRRYHAGEIKVLCNADLLIEGFDEPKASVCLNLRPTKSVVVAQQRAGRVLRLDPDNPNKYAVIVDFLDKTDDPRKLSVTFAEVAEAARILTKRTRVGVSSADTLNTENTDLNSELNGTLSDDLGDDLFDFEEDKISISGLKVIVNPKEVMRIVKEMQDRQYTDLQETDLPLTNSKLRRTFIGRPQRIRLIIETLGMRLLKENPEEYNQLFVRRKFGSHLIDACTDPSKLIPLVLEQGILPQSENIRPIQQGEVILNADNIGSIFVGGVQKFSLVEEVREALSEQNPELFQRLFAKRQGRNNLVVEVCTDRNYFIELMKEKGLELKDPNTQELNNDDFPLIATSLLEVFVGDYSKLLQLTEKVKIKISKEQSGHDLFVQRKKYTRIIEVCTDRDFFIGEMLKEGAELKVKDRLYVQPGDFPLEKHRVREIFKGNDQTLRTLIMRAKERVKNECPEEYENLFIKRKSGTRTLEVCTDIDLFVSMMIEVGGILK